ncbi:MAG TPA: hypothetical protein VH475_01400 [Tepidisphaeraceae bacterium]
MRCLTLLCGVIIGTLIGCSSQTGPDSNTAVFKTPEQAVEARKHKLMQDWQEMAAKIANAERPDIKTRKAPEGFALIMSADGLEQPLDLAPLTETLTSASVVGKERDPIRAYLLQHFPPFDRVRLKALGFARVRSMLMPYLANLKESQELAGGNTLITNRVVIDLNWLPVVRWPGSDAQTPVEEEVATSWKTPADQVSAAAMENLRQSFTSRSVAAFETVDLPGMGRYGTLRTGVDPAVILLPEFLSAVRKDWKSTDDLVLFLPSRHSVNFLERKNERLLNQMIPQWTTLYTRLADPLIGTMVLDGEHGLALFSYTPPTAPGAKPATRPATKRVYIVH